MDKIIFVPIIITIIVIGVIGWALLSGDTEPTVSSKDISIKSGSNTSPESQEENTEESAEEEEISNDNEVEVGTEESSEETSDEVDESEDINEDEEEGISEEDTDDEYSGEDIEEESFEEEVDEEIEEESSEETSDEVSSDEVDESEDINEDEEDMITGDVVKAQSKKPTKTLKKIVEPLLKIEYKVPERYQRLLPLTAKITSGKQVVYLEGTADGVKITDKIEESDIEIRGPLKDLEKLSKIKNINSLKKVFEETKVQVKSNTFKGATVITAIEEITETKLVERSFIQKIIGTGISAATGKFTYGITSITGNFVLNNLN